MLSLKLIREHTEAVREALANRRETAPIDEIVAADDDRMRRGQGRAGCGNTSVGNEITSGRDARCKR